MPGGAASPLPNRNSYKPPMMKRPAENMQQQRPPLGDVSAGSINVPIDSGGDAKRQRVGVGVGNCNEQINEGTRGIVTG